MQYIMYECALSVHAHMCINVGVGVGVCVCGCRVHILYMLYTVCACDVVCCRKDTWDSCGNVCVKQMW